jgi:bacillithiol synthase
MPHLSRLFLDYAERRQPLIPFFPSSAYSTDWTTAPIGRSEKHRAALCDLLDAQNKTLLPIPAKLQENLDRLRDGAGAVVTGQQVALFGGPLFTLLKAATVIRKAQDASLSGRPHVPIFWLATEDHDLAEADHVTVPASGELRTLRVVTSHSAAQPVGGIAFGQNIEPVLDQVAEILGPGPLFDDLVSCYRSDATFSSAFAGFLARVFAAHGLIILDASSRPFHALGSSVLREAIVRAGELHAALVERDKQLRAAGYHSQVLVSENSSLLFLIDSASRARLPLRRTKAGDWQASRQIYSTAELLAILDAEPERLSPNALLRPVFQDAILPTSAYIGGPAEIAYFAQSQVLYECILGRSTPVLPRLSATLIEPPIASALDQHGLSLPDVIEAGLENPMELAQRLGARALPVEAKRKLASAGNALEEELSSLTSYMRSLNESVGRASDVAASKMRYQMNRLRRLAANFQLQREQSLGRHAQAIMLNLFPDRHPQERVLGAAWFLSRYGESLPEILVEHAAQQCPGHKAIWL